MKANDLDPYAILQTLGIHNPTQVIEIHGGSDTAIWRVESQNKTYALRVFDKGEHSDCQHEMQCMQTAYTLDIPIPEVLTTGSWQDHPALLLSWVSGQTVASELQKKPWNAWKQGILFGNMQARLHALPLSNSLIKKLEITSVIPSEDILYKKLQNITSERLSLLHMDYHPLNVMTDGERITGVLDWRNACIGDARADIARTRTILCLDAPSHLGIPGRIILAIFTAAWHYGYTRYKNQLKDMPAFYAWAGIFMEHDLATKRTPEELAHIHHWTAKWKTRIR